MASDRFTYDLASRRYRDSQTGRFLSKRTVRNLRDAYLDAAKETTATLAEGLEAGSLTLTQWQRRMRTVIRDVHVGVAALGGGGRNAMTASDWGKVGAQVQDQYEYLDNFTRQIGDGELSLAQVTARAGLYVDAAVQGFERAKVARIGDLDLPAYPGDGGTPCVTGDTYVGSGAIERIYRRWYEGSIINLETADGHKLTVTPNHPILTDQGWVPAGLLRYGQNLVCYALQDGDTAAQHNPDSTPTMIRKRFSAAQAERRCRHEQGPMDFHGDGMNGQVDVITVNRLLGNDTDPSVTQPLKDHVLAEAHYGFRLAGKRLANELIGRRCLTTDFVVSSMGEALPLVSAKLGHSECHGLGTVPGSHACRSEALVNGASGNVEVSSNRVDAFTGEIEPDYLSHSHVRSWRESFSGKHHPDSSESAPDSPASHACSQSQSSDALPGLYTLQQLIRCDWIPFHGYVFNLQTASGHYHANGIIIHNCLGRCLCEWEVTSGDEGITASWKRNGADSCDGCVEREQEYAALLFPAGEETDAEERLLRAGRNGKR